MKTYLYAQTSLTTNKLYFRFKAPYALAQVESINFISSSTSYPAPANPNLLLHCIVQPSTQSSKIFGFGYYSSCSYNNGVYSVKMPIGGLTTG
jgi:hypothetical protein